MDIQEPEHDLPPSDPSPRSGFSWLIDRLLALPKLLLKPANLKKLIIGVVVVVILLVIRAIFFPAPDKEKAKKEILDIIKDLIKEGRVK